MPVVTTTSAGPTTPGGVVALRDVALLKVTLAAGTFPMVNVDPGSKPFPVIFTPVPPAVVPIAGLMPDIIGAAGGVTVKITGMLRGEPSAPGASIVTTPLYVPWLSAEAFTLTAIVPGTVPLAGVTASQLA